MGTRNLSIAVVDGEVKVAQYGQWDGYPSGNGLVVFNFVKELLRNNKVDEMKEKVRACRFVDSKNVSEKYEALGIDTTSNWVTLEDAEKFKKAHPQLDRDMGAEIFSYIMEHGGCELKNNISFAADSLFCEWAYLIDFDNEVLECYEGFNKNGIDENDRFYYLKEKSDEGYFPIRKCAVFTFSQVLDMTEEAFLKELEGDEE